MCAHRISHGCGIRAEVSLPSDLDLYEPATAFDGDRDQSLDHTWTLQRGLQRHTLHVEGGATRLRSGSLRHRREFADLRSRSLRIWKKLAHRIELIHHDDGQVEALMEVKPGDRALRALVRASKNEPAEAVATLPLICLKDHPGCGRRRKPALAQLILVRISAKPLMGSDGKAEVYSGPGILEFGSPSNARLPVQSILSCKYAHFNADLPYGKVLKTFKDSEL